MSIQPFSMCALCRLAVIRALCLAVAVALVAALPHHVPAQTGQSPYQIGPADLIEITVVGAQEVGGQHRVSQAGTIAMPLLGELQVTGMTAGDLATDLESRLATYIREPEVEVFVREFKRFRFSIMGAVSGPGVYDMSDSLTLLEGLALAGGVNFDRAAGTITLLRETAADPILIDLDDLLQLRADAFSLELLPGDFIHVLERRSFEVFIQGQVKQPGSKRVEEGITLLKAITLAGGFEERAAKGRVRIVRTSSDGEQEVLQFDVEKISEGKTPDVVLEAGDLIFVPRTFF